MKNVLIGLAVAAVLGLGVGYLWQSEKQQASYIPPGEQGMVGATIPKVVSLFETSLQSSISDTATSMTLVSGTDRAGNSLSGFYCFTIDEGTSSAEFVCGTASGTSVTGMTRGVSPTTGTSTVASLKYSHRRGASVKITNYPQLAVVSRILNSDETIPNALRYDSSVASSSLGGNLQNLASVAYVNGVTVNAGTLWLAGGSNSIYNSNSGNVGIGTSTTSDILSVYGNAAFINVASTSTLQGTVKFSSPDHTTSYAGIAGKTASGGTDQVDLLFYTAYGTTSEKMRLLSNTGYLGIGTSTPLGNLVIQGSSGQTANLLTIASSSGRTLFAVSATGTVITLNSVPYAFPASQGSASTTLINNGSGTLSWGVPGPGALSVLLEPAIGPATTTANSSGTNTAGITGRVTLRNQITVNKLSIFGVTAATPGNIAIGLYSEDGQTQYASSTINISGPNAVYTATLSSPVTLNPGIYYVVWVTKSTTNVGLLSYSAGTNILHDNLGLSKPVYEGTLTVSSGTLPTTFTPSSISYAPYNTLIVRLDN